MVTPVRLNNSDIPIENATIDQMVADLASSDEGWWHQHNGDTVKDVLTDMIDNYYLPKDVAYSWVAAVVGAISDEYGD